MALAVGALNTLLFATVLRFDLRVVPAFVAAQVGAAIVAEALLQRTASGYVFAALSLATTLLIAWAATRYLVRAGDARQPSTALARLAPLLTSIAACLLHRHPVRNDLIVGAVVRGDVAARGPRNHLPVQRQVIDLGVVRGKRSRISFRRCSGFMSTLTFAVISSSLGFV